VLSSTVSITIYGVINDELLPYLDRLISGSLPR